MQKALLVGIAISIACSMLGFFLVTKKYSLFGDAMSHLALSGIAIGVLLKIYPLWTALIVSPLASLGITRLRNETKLQGDAVVAILFISSVGLAILLISASKGSNVDLFSYLFGSIFLISNEDLITALIVSVIVTFSILILKDKLFYMSLDEEQAKISGIKVNLLDYIFIILASISVIIAIRLVGTLLISSLIVLPNVASMMLGKGFKATILSSIVISIASVTIGIISSYYLNVVPSGMITFVGIAILICIMVAKKIKS